MDSKSSINNSIQYVNESSFRNLFANPLYVSLTIAFSIMLIIISIYEKNRTVKTLFYITLVTVALVFIHNKLILIDCRKEQLGTEVSNLTNIIDSGPKYQVKSSFGGSDVLKHISI